jgi:hypothetical protein
VDRRRGVRKAVGIRNVDQMVWNWKGPIGLTFGEMD